MTEQAAALLPPAPGRVGALGPARAGTLIARNLRELHVDHVVRAMRLLLAPRSLRLRPRLPGNGLPASEAIGQAPPNQIAYLRDQQKRRHRIGNEAWNHEQDAGKRHRSASQAAAF